MLFPDTAEAKFCNDGLLLPELVVKADRYQPHTQGMCVAGDDVIVSKTSSDSSPTTYICYSLEDGHEINHCSFQTGHSNSMTYNPVTKEIAVATDGMIYTFAYADGKMAKRNTYRLGFHAVKIAYAYNGYYISTGRRVFYTKNFKNFSLLFATSPLGVNQGLGSDGTDFYIPWYQSATSIQVKNKNGQEIRKITLDNSKYREIEEVDFWKDNMIINVTTSGSYNGIYKIPSNHSYGSWVVIKEANCQQDGERQRKCTKCGAEETEKITSEGQHVPGKWNVVTKPTCGEAGLKRSRCTLCNEIVEKEIEPTGKHVKGKWKLEKEADCENNGAYVLRCKKCYQIIKSKEIPATGHNYGDWEIIKEPTALKDGKKRRQCSKCNKFEYETITKLDAYIKGDSKLETRTFGTKKLKLDLEQGDKIVSYESDKKYVVSVKDGSLRGWLPGKAKIKVKTKSGLTKTITVTNKLF